MKNEILNVCNQLVVAAANGVYQGIIIALLVALGLRFLVRTNAATRHGVWFCTLLLLVTLVMAHCWVDSSSLRRAISTNTSPGSSVGSAMPITLPHVVTSAVPTEDGSIRSTHLSDDWSNPEPHPLLAALILAQQESAESINEREQSNEAEPSQTQSDEAGLPSHASSGTIDFHRLRDRLLNPIALELPVGSGLAQIGCILLGLWLAIAGLRILTLIVQLTRIRRLKQASLLPGTELSELFQRLCAQLITQRKVELRVSSQHQSSFLLGFLHPVVLLPAEERMERAETELVLRHELAHVERRDDWVNLVQHGVLAVFFFHPAFWWISRRLSLEREIACDDYVLQQSKRPRAYALVLANLAARMQKQFRLLAPGSSNNKTQLKERIDMILNTHRNASPRLVKTWLALITSAAAIAAIAVICLAPRLVLAQVETTSVGATVAPAADILPVMSLTEVTEPSSPVPADNVPPTPLPAAVNVGPKVKGRSPVGLSTSPAVTIAPDIALAPMTTRLSVVAALPGQPAKVLAAIEPPSGPGTPRAPRPAKAPRSENSDSSLEERLDRLERMVTSLMNQQNQKGRSDFQLKLEKDGMIDRKELARIEGWAKQQADLAKINPQDIEKIKEQAKREASRAVEQAKRATADVEKAKAEKRQAVRKVKADSQRQLEDLRRQAEALERQREKLDREIERLEQDREDLDNQDDDSADIGTDPGESREISVTHSHSHTTR